jgi:uncharacterized alkaline shock family protein YloU
MERSLISGDVLARYAADAARQVEGVVGLADGLRSWGKSVAVSGDDDTLAIVLSLELEWGRNASDVGREVQRRVVEYLGKMANASPVSVDVVVGTVSPPPPKR